MSMPVLALVGRPNVGKSTLFNQLTRSRDALVADLPGLTRDRQYGVCRRGPRPCLVVDTGGLSGEEDGIDGLIRQQAELAVAEADAVLFLVDARGGLTAGDEAVAERLRQAGKPLWLVVNKTEHQDLDAAVAEFHSLGLGVPVAISASHNRGVADLLELVFSELPALATDLDEPSEAEPGDTIRLAVVGRPNVGKSTLVNRILGEERVLAYDLPGTTRDAVEIPFARDGRDYVLIDTAGVRRRGRVRETVEKFSVLKTLEAITQANVVVLVVDARQGIADQDATLLGQVIDEGRALVLAVNKWDRLEPDQRRQVKSELSRRLGFLDFADRHFISALHGTGVGDVIKSVNRSFDSAVARFGTPQLSRILEDAVGDHPPPLVAGQRIKLRYAHQGGRNPPLVVIHGTRVDKLPASYQRYLANCFRHALKIHGTPLRVEFRAGENPYAERAAGRRRPERPGGRGRRR